MIALRMLLIGMFGAITLIGGGCAHAPGLLCDRIAEIRSIPMKGLGRDEAYLALMEAAEEDVIPCLIERISDTTPVVDPRMAPRFHGTVMGDVAIFVLGRKTGLGLPEFLPQDVREKYRNRGIYAYFDYVAEPAHRRDLQERWREWWRGKEYISDRSDTSDTS
jgi:hypothetical protein